MPPLGTPLAHSKFSLNSAGVAGFFGGKEAISAMATVHLYTGRRWLGWYNSPGSYTIAKRFGRMANSRFWDGLFPGPNDPPATSFALDGKQGPKYIAALSGTTMQTGHLGYLTMERSKDMEPTDIPGRETASVCVSYLAMKKVNYETPVELQPLKDALVAIIPITCSVAACVFSALVCDWYSFSSILLGIFSSGLASCVIGAGKLVLKTVKKPADGCPPGHGVLFGEHDIVVIKGNESDVNAITKGHFDLETDSQEGSKKKNQQQGNKETDSQQGRKETESQQGTKENGSRQIFKAKGAVRCYHAIGCSSLLLAFQFLFQLQLIPQASLVGQIMVLSSLGVSWAYNSYLSSLEKEKTQAKILFQKLDNPEMLRFCTGTRTTMAVFVCLLLFHGVDVREERKGELFTKALRSCIPNDTVVWKRWLALVVEQLLHLPDSLPRLENADGDQENRADSEPFPHLKNLEEGDSDLTKQDRNLLNQLLNDARSAIKGYFTFRDRLPNDSSHD